MSKDEALQIALEVMKLANSSHNMVLTSDPPQSAWRYHNVDMKLREAISAIKVALEAKDEPWEQFYPEMGKPYAFEASMYPRVIIDPVTGNVSIGTVTMPCGLKCDCTDVCKQDDYKALWQQMCERCDELDKKLAQQEHGWTSERIAGMARLKAQQDSRLEPQRTWIGLTDEEILLIAADCAASHQHTDLNYERALEAKLKEKNT